MVWQEDAQNFKSVKVVPRNSIEPGHQPTSMTTKHQNTIYYKVEVPEAGPGCDSRGVIRLEIHGFTSGLTSSLNIMEYNHETTFNDLVACYNQPVYIEKQHEVSRSETRVYMSWRCECPGELSCDWSAYSGATGGVTVTPLHHPLPLISPLPASSPPLSDTSAHTSPPYPPLHHPPLRYFCTRRRGKTSSTKEPTTCTYA